MKPTETHIAQLGQWEVLRDEGKEAEADRLASSLYKELGSDGWDALLELVNPEPDSLYREKSAPETAFVPIRKEEWIESEEYPGIWTNASGEVMDGATKKVRTVTTAFNPKTRRYSSRVWLNGEYKAKWWQQLMIERNRLRPKKGGERLH